MGDPALAVIFALLVAIFAGPVFALMFRIPAARKTHEAKKAQFSQGLRRKDPDTELMGPHRSFLRNWLVASGICGAFAAAILAAMGALAG